MRIISPSGLVCHFILNVRRLNKIILSKSLPMYRAKCFHALFREAAFYYKNLGLDASAGERSTLAGILMRHIAMVRSMGCFVIKGLVHPDRRFPLTKFDDNEPDKVSILVNHLVRELMMGKKIMVPRLGF
jgi:hypothetical protein